MNPPASSATPTRASGDRTAAWPAPAGGAGGASSAPLIAIQDLDFFYGSTQVLCGITLGLADKKATAFIGPSGCGKTTLLRCLNRLNDLIEGARIARGTITIHGVDVNQPEVDVIELRRRVGMVFQEFNPFPKSIFDNVAYGLRLRGVISRPRLDAIVEAALRAAALWDEVKDRLGDHALRLSAGQQQRLCIARAIALEPRVILMDEPCSALDPVATARIEELIQDLRRQYCIVIVTHNLQQAARCSDRTAFFYQGRLIEYNATRDLFTNPANPQTEAYVLGRFG